MEVVSSDTTGGASLRRLLPAMVVVPVAFGWLGLRGQRAGLYGSEIGVAILTLASIVFLVLLASWNTRVIIRSEAARTEGQARFLEQQAALRAEIRLRSLIESVQDAIISGDEAGKIIGWNRGAERMFGYSREEALGQSVNILVPEGERDAQVANLRLLMASTNSREAGVVLERHGLRKDGARILCEVSLTVFDAEEGSTHTSVVRDITERRRAEELRAVAEAALRASLQEKEVLLKEIHHRVKNNLQVVSSLLKLQGEYLTDARARASCRESQDRIRAIALLHEKLYQTRTLVSVDVGDYVSSLIETLLRSHGKRSAELPVIVRAAGIHMQMDMAVPCGLILNELITNALKHAFPASSQRQPELRVELCRLDKDLELSVTDNGVGLPAGFAPEKLTSLGMHLVRTLSRQIGGTVRFVSEGGTRVSVRFPEHPDEDE